MLYGEYSGQTRLCPYTAKECGRWCKFLDRENNCLMIQVEEFFLRLEFRGQPIIPLSGMPS